MNNTLFPIEIPKNNDPLKDIDITTTLLYMSTEELKEFKKLAKDGIKYLWQDEFQQRGNLTDFILYLMRKYNDEVVQKTIN